MKRVWRDTVELQGDRVGLSYDEVGVLQTVVEFSISNVDQKYPRMLQCNETTGEAYLYGDTDKLNEYKQEDDIQKRTIITANETFTPVDATVCCVMNLV